MFNRDLAGTRFSPLTQINVSNVSKLAPAWSYKLRPRDGKRARIYELAVLDTTEVDYVKRRRAGLGAALVAGGAS